MKQKILLSNELIKIRSGKGLTLETLAFQIFHGGNSAFINSFEKKTFFFHSSTDVVPQFLEKQEMHRALNQYLLKCVIL